MSDPRTPLATSFRELPAEEAQREERHQLLATLLGGFADGELPAETASQIDAHLLGCPRCRRELVMHRTLRLRLEQEPLAPAPTALRDRIIAAVAATPAPQWEALAGSASSSERVSAVRRMESLGEGSVARPVHRTRFAFGRTGIALAAAAGLALAAFGVRWLVQRRAAPTVSIVSPSSVPLFSAALADYRRVTRGDLPGRARDLAAVRDAMPFPVRELQAPSLRLLAAWTTSLNGEPAAVLAYRWDDYVVLQYLVSELQLYRPAEVRGAFGNGRVLAAHDGLQNVVSWPDTAWGSLVVGDIPLDRLKQLRGAVQSR